MVKISNSKINELLREIFKSLREESGFLSYCKKNTKFLNHIRDLWTIDPEKKSRNYLILQILQLLIDDDESMYKKANFWNGYQSTFHYGFQKPRLITLGLNCPISIALMFLTSLFNKPFKVIKAFFLSDDVAYKNLNKFFTRILTDYYIDTVLPETFIVK